MTEQQVGAFKVLIALGEWCEKNAEDGKVDLQALLGRIETTKYVLTHSTRSG